MGERYKMVTKETKDLFAGKYGKLPMPINEEVAKKVLGDTKRITYRPADDLKPEYEDIKRKMFFPMPYSNRWLRISSNGEKLRKTVSTEILPREMFIPSEKIA